MVLIELFVAFCKVGFTSFGGLSMVPLINGEMIAHGWMTTTEVSDIIAIAEATPGPLGLNCATFAGTRVAGFFGGLFAAVGVLSPTLLVGTIVALTFQKFRKSKAMDHALFGLRPACLGMIVGVLVTLAMTNYLSLEGVVSPQLIAIGAVALVCLLKFKWAIPKVIALSAALGLLLVR